MQECMQWAEIFVHESMTQLLAAVAEDNSELRTKWLTIINNTILCILTCVHHKGPEVCEFSIHYFIVSSLPVLIYVLYYN